MNPEHYSMIIRWDPRDDIYIVDVPNFLVVEHMAKHMLRQSKTHSKLSSFGLMMP